MSDRYAIKRIKGLEDQLATLRSEVAYVRGHLESFADALDRPYPFNRDELKRALREDSERLGKLGGSE